MKTPFSIIASALVAAAAAFAAPDPDMESEYEDAVVSTNKGDIVIPANAKRLCKRYATFLQTKHLNRKSFDQDVSAQAWTNFFSHLDYDRSYFLQSDLDAFESHRLTLCDELVNGDLTFATNVFSVFRKRMTERLAFAEALIDDATNIDYTVDEEYTWKRKDMPWPQSQEEQDELWRKRIKNELLARIVSRDFNAAKTNEVEAAGATNVADVAEAATTNAVAAAEAASTNATETAEAEVADDDDYEEEELTPDAFVRKRYKQYATIIADADADWLIERYLNAFAAIYDPHTNYMAPASAEDFNIDMNLKLCGIGATLQADDGTAKVVEIIPGSPASRDTREIRLRKNDRIIGVGQGDGPIEDIVHLPLSKIVKRIRGEKGTKVVLHVISASDPSGSTTRKVDIIRDEIKLEEQAATGHVVRVSAPLDGKERAFGVVKLPMFYGSNTTNPRDPNFRSCTYDVTKCIAGMGPSIKGLVLDLRGNGGGSLREAVSLAGSFFSTGPVVLVKDPGNVGALPDTDPAIAFSKPMVVLVDRASASASEIVAAALQDYGRAVVVGDSKTHGKGSVQTVMPLMAADDSYGTLKITCAEFYRVTGGSTQLEGVHSDIVLPSLLEYLDIGEDKYPNALPYSQIARSRFNEVCDLGKIIPGLAKASSARTATNEEYQAHMKIVEHMKDVSERKSMPLAYDKRYAICEAEDNINKLQDRLEDEEDEAPEDGIGKDVVLREALNILSDLVDVQGDNAIPDDSSNLFDNIFRSF